MRLRKQTERWFPVPDDPDGARIKQRPLTPGEDQDIIDESAGSVEYQVDDAGRPVPIYKERKEQLRIRRELSLQKQVVDWEHVLDEDGSPLECTDENKVLVARSIPGFVETVLANARQLKADLAKEKKAKEKN